MMSRRNEVAIGQQGDISTDESGTKVPMIPTDEELAIAGNAYQPMLINPPRAH